MTSSSFLLQKQKKINDILKRIDTKAIDYGSIKGSETAYIGSTEYHIYAPLYLQIFKHYYPTLVTLGKEDGPAAGADEIIVTKILPYLEKQIERLNEEIKKIETAKPLAVKKLLSYKQERYRYQVVYDAFTNDRVAAFKSLFHPKCKESYQWNITRPPSYVGENPHDVNFRELAALYWLAASDPDMLVYRSLLEETNTENIEIKTEGKEEKTERKVKVEEDKHEAKTERKIEAKLEYKETKLEHKIAPTGETPVRLNTLHGWEKILQDSIECFITMMADAVTEYNNRDSSGALLETDHLKAIRGPSCPPGSGGRFIKKGLYANALGRRPPLQSPWYYLHGNITQFIIDEFRKCTPPQKQAIYGFLSAAIIYIDTNPEDEKVFDSCITTVKRKQLDLIDYVRTQALPICKELTISHTQKSDISEIFNTELESLKKCPDDPELFVKLLNVCRQDILTDKKEKIIQDAKHELILGLSYIKQEIAILTEIIEKDIARAQFLPSYLLTVNIEVTAKKVALLQSSIRLLLEKIAMKMTAASTIVGDSLGLDEKAIRSTGDDLLDGFNQAAQFACEAEQKKITLLADKQVRLNEMKVNPTERPNPRKQALFLIDVAKQDSVEEVIRLVQLLKDSYTDFDRVVNITKILSLINNSLASQCGSTDQGKTKALLKYAFELIGFDLGSKDRAISSKAIFFEEIQDAALACALDAKTHASLSTLAEMPLNDGNNPWLLSLAVELKKIDTDGRRRQFDIEQKKLMAIEEAKNQFTRTTGMTATASHRRLVRIPKSDCPEFLRQLNADEETAIKKLQADIEAEKINKVCWFVSTALHHQIGLTNFIDYESIRDICAAYLGCLHSLALPKCEGESKGESKDVLTEEKFAVSRLKKLGKHICRLINTMSDPKTACLLKNGVLRLLTFDNTQKKICEMKEGGVCYIGMSVREPDVIGVSISICIEKAENFIWRTKIAPKDLHDCGNPINIHMLQAKLSKDLTDYIDGMFNEIVDEISKKDSEGKPTEELYTKLDAIEAYGKEIAQGGKFIYKVMGEGENFEKTSHPALDTMVEVAYHSLIQSFADNKPISAVAGVREDIRDRYQSRSRPKSPTLFRTPSPSTSSHSTSSWQAPATRT